MNIVFDLVHPADVNLFKNSIYALAEKGWKVNVIYRERGALERIAKSELPDFQVQRIGKHRKSLAGKIISLISREIEAFFFLKKNKAEILVCQGIACGISCKLLNVRILHYDDDSEYKLTFLMGKYFADIDVMPDFMPVSGKNFFKYRGFKELAYLHPHYFTPVLKAIEKYRVDPGEYAFIREISSVSMNYKNQKAILPSIVKYLRKKNLKILLSLENKALTDLYKDDCIILQEPVENLYSLIFYSGLVISSGDTMAREACLSGVSCIYTGGREMLANDRFIRLGVMHKLEEPNEIYNKIDELTLPGHLEKTRSLMQGLIETEFEDTNQVLLRQIEKLGDRISTKNV